MTSRRSHQHTLGINRRELLQVGYSGLIDPRSIIKDRVDRPAHANEGEPIATLFTGAAS